jgi:hypothetical protein
VGGERTERGGAGGVASTVTVDIVTDGGDVCVVVQGAVDGWTRLTLFEAVWTAAAEPGELALDLRGVTSADAAGVQGLVELWRIGVVRRFDDVPAVVRAIGGRAHPELFGG